MSYPDILNTFCVGVLAFMAVMVGAHVVRAHRQERAARRSLRRADAEWRALRGRIDAGTPVPGLTNEVKFYPIPKARD